MSRVMRFFVFIHRYGVYLRKRLHDEMGRLPNRNELLRRYHFAFHHVENIRKMGRVQLTNGCCCVFGNIRKTC